MRGLDKPISTRMIKLSVSMIKRKRCGHCMCQLIECSLIRAVISLLAKLIHKDDPGKNLYEVKAWSSCNGLPVSISSSSRLRSLAFACMNLLENAPARARRQRALIRTTTNGSARSAFGETEQQSPSPSGVGRHSKSVDLSERR